MYEYMTEVLRTNVKALYERVDSADLSQFNDVFNQRESEGWELVTYAFVNMSVFLGVRGTLIVTYRRQK